MHARGSSTIRATTSQPRMATNRKATSVLFLVHLHTVPVSMMVLSQTSFRLLLGKIGSKKTIWRHLRKYDKAVDVHPELGPLRHRLSPKNNGPEKVLHEGFGCCPRISLFAVRPHKGAFAPRAGTTLPRGLARPSREKCQRQSLETCTTHARCVRSQFTIAVPYCACLCYGGKTPLRTPTRVSPVTPPIQCVKRMLNCFCLVGTEHSGHTQRPDLPLLKWLLMRSVCHLCLWVYIQNARVPDTHTHTSLHIVAACTAACAGDNLTHISWFHQCPGVRSHVTLPPTLG